MISYFSSRYIAMIIDYRDCCLREPSFGCQWIMWYGDYTFSQVNIRSRNLYLICVNKIIYESKVNGNFCII